MPNIDRVRVSWTGFPGAPGVSTFYALDGPAMLPHLKTYFDAMRGQIPADVTMTIENFGDIIEPISGDLVSSWVGEVQAPSVGEQNGQYAAPVGACVNWLTGDVLDGHRLRGRTYFVPLASAAFDLTGSINSTVLTAYRAFSETFRTDETGNFVIWHRPRVAKAADGSRPAVEARAGGYSVVTGSQVPDESVVLRSRRD